MGTLPDLEGLRRAFEGLPRDPALSNRMVLEHDWTQLRLRSFTRKVVRDRHLAIDPQDLAQEVAVLWLRRPLNLDLSRPTPALGRFLSTRLRWFVLAAARRLRRPAPPCTGAPDVALPDTELDVAELLDQLPAEQRDVIRLRVAGHRLKEVASRLGRSISWAHAQARAAQRSIQNALRP